MLTAILVAGPGNYPDIGYCHPPYCPTAAFVLYTHNSVPPWGIAELVRSSATVPCNQWALNPFRRILAAHLLLSCIYPRLSGVPGVPGDYTTTHPAAGAGFEPAQAVAYTVLAKQPLEPNLSIPTYAQPESNRGHQVSDGAAFTGRSLPKEHSLWKQKREPTERKASYWLLHR